MKFNLPRSEHPLVKVTATAGNWSCEMVLDQSHRECEILLPQEIDEADVKVTAEFCNGRSQPVESSYVLKDRVEKPKPVLPKSPPKVETKAKAEPEVTSGPKIKLDD